MSELASECHCKTIEMDLRRASESLVFLAGHPSGNDVTKQCTVRGASPQRPQEESNAG